MKSSKFFAVAALSALAAFGSVAQARTVAGEVGMIEVPTQSTLERSVVRTQAADAVRQGLVPSGEASVVRAQAPAAPQRPPIVFVHGNGDNAALWMTTLWRFESNGWPRERLHAITLPYPLARDADDQPQPGRSSSEEARRFLAAEVDAVLQRSGASQVVLVGNSRGGIVIRNYVAGGGAAKVSHAILGGAPNHGVWSSASFRPTSEFNGAGPLLTRLNNQGGAGIEITPGPQWMTIRSDNNDKYAQADGAWIGAKGTPTHVSFAGPELKGAHNVVIAGIDHRETAFGPQAFAAMWRFLAGNEPATTRAVPEARITLAGMLSGAAVDNLPLAGATVTLLYNGAPINPAWVAGGSARSCMQRGCP